MTDILDIKPPLPYGPPPWVWFLILAVLVVLAAILGLYLWRRFSARKARRMASAAPLPPDEAALAGLRELAGRDDLDDRLYYFRLSAILRGYLDGRFGLDTMEKTAEEVVGLLARSELGGGDPSGLAEFVRFSDPVKFASVPAGRDRRERDRAFIEEFVRSTRPAAEEGARVQV